MVNGTPAELSGRNDSGALAYGAMVPLEADNATLCVRGTEVRGRPRGLCRQGRQCPPSRLCAPAWPPSGLSRPPSPALITAPLALAHAAAGWRPCGGAAERRGHAAQIWGGGGRAVRLRPARQRLRVCRCTSQRPAAAVQLQGLAAEPRVGAEPVQPDVQGVGVGGRQGARCLLRACGRQGVGQVRRLQLPADAWPERKLRGTFFTHVHRPAAAAAATAAAAASGTAWRWCD